MPEEPKTEAPRPVRLLRGKDYRVAYANTFRFRVTSNDVSIVFGYNTEVPMGVSTGPAQSIIQDEVEIVVTPSVLKLLHLAIADNLEALELELGGPIPIPQEFMDALADAKAKLLTEKTQKKGSSQRSSEDATGKGNG